MKNAYSKLTLRIEEPLIKAAKKYSKTQGKSLSQLIADYLYIITKAATNANVQLPITNSLKGILQKSSLKEQDYKKYLKDKYQ